MLLRLTLLIHLVAADGYGVAKLVRRVEVGRLLTAKEGGLYLNLLWNRLVKEACFCRQNLKSDLQEE